MVKFLIGLATGVALVFLSFILLFVVALRFRESPPSIASNSVLVLRLSGELPEKPPMELPSFVSDDHAPLTVIGVWSALGQGRGRRAHQGGGPSARRPLRGMGQARRTASRRRQVQEVRQARLRLPAATGNARVLRGRLRRPDLSRSVGTGNGQRPARRNDVLQEHPGKDWRQRGDRTRRQVQGLRRHVHPHRYEPGDTRSHDQRGGRPVRRPGGGHRLGTPEIAGSRFAPSSTRDPSPQRRR